VAQGRAIEEEDNVRVGLNLDELRRSVPGHVIGPDDDGYESARRCFNAAIDRRPAVIVRCVSPRDVAAAFQFAQVQGLEVTVRGGGHNPAGHCVCDGGLVIDLSMMRKVNVDARARVARAGGGATWLDFDTATQMFGLVTPGGVVVSTGVCGLALGGGIGHLTAQYGLTCDQLIGAEIVTPDGTIVHAGPDENAELLWGLRGGGGNFGVATHLDFRLHSLQKVVGGVLRYRGPAVRDALRHYRDVVEESPHDLSCQVELSANESGVALLNIVPCYTGRSADPEHLRALRSAPGLVDDGLREHTFLDQQRVSDSPYGTNRHYWKGLFVRALPDEAIDAMFERLTAFHRPPCHILIESLHGAPKDSDPGIGVAGFRNAAFNISAMAVWKQQEHDGECIAWTRGTAQAIEPWSSNTGGYVNYMQADEPIERVRATFGAAGFERLQALKRRFDPNNVLHRNQNVPPPAKAASGGAN
jgi:FAD/FMN-containing dehydrogenase